MEGNKKETKKKRRKTWWIIVWLLRCKEYKRYKYIKMVKDDAETAALKQELNELIDKVKGEQKKQEDCKLAEKCGDMGGAPKCPLSTKKTLKGHINKVNSVHFAGDSRFD